MEDMTKLEAVEVLLRLANKLDAKMPALEQELALKAKDEKVLHGVITNMQDCLIAKKRELLAIHIALNFMVGE